MLILSALSSPLYCQSITGSPAIAGLCGGDAKEPENHPMGIDVVSANPGDRIFRLIHSGLNLEPFIHSGRCRQKPEPT
ncbi:MAG: hypothetical protein LH647_09350 [Leptolyngbyaceae cyanobacterium CAN_BIN12]|nr:hypothetical protein [Leptolyngbyaceae cyanobacterium CAN_BIN12]